MGCWAHMLQLCLRAWNVKLLDKTEQTSEDFVERVQALIQRDLTQIKSSCRSPFLAEYRLRMAVGQHESLFSGTFSPIHVLVVLNLTFPFAIQEGILSFWQCSKLQILYSRKCIGHA